MRRSWNLAIAALIIIGVGWIWVNRVRDGAASRTQALPPAPAIGHPAPDFSGMTLDGEKFSPSELRGKPVVLNFWATWCPPCRAELPELEAASRRYAGEVHIIGLNEAERLDDVRAFVAEQGLTFPIRLDPFGAAGRAYAVRSLPTPFFIDRDGVIRKIQIGPVTQATLAELLESIYP